MFAEQYESAPTDAGGGRMVLTFAVRSASINKDYPLMTKSRSIFLLALGGLLFLAPAVRSQSLRGSIVGRVLDASNLPLANAAVTLVEVETNRERTTKSGVNGEFAITLLPPGTYRVAASFVGYRKSIRSVVL